MAKPNGSMSIGQGKARLRRVSDDTVISLSAYLTGVSVSNAEKPTGETPVEDGVIMGLGQRGGSSAECTLVYTEGETANDQGDIYRDEVYPLYNDPAREHEDWVIEWQKKGAWQGGGQPFAAGSDGWTTDANFSRVVLADAPSIERTGNTATIVKFKISTESINTLTFA